MTKNKPEDEEVRPSSHDSSGFPTSARPVIRILLLLFVGLVTICLVTTKACKSEPKKIVPPPEKIKGIVQVL